MLRYLTCTVPDPWPSLPRLLRVGHERQASREYVRSGRLLQQGHCVLQYTLAGAGEAIDGHGCHPLPAGHLFLARLPDPAFTWRLPATARVPWEFLWMEFLGGGSEAVVDELVARFGHRHALPATHPQIERLRRLSAGGGSTAPIAAIDGAGMVNGLLHALADRPAPIADARSIALARRGVALIRSRSRLPEDVNALAQQLGVSREHLSRVFTRHLGLSPHACLTEARLERACTLLTTTPATNRAIAEAVGLASAGQLVRLFRRVLGVTPQRYREHGEARRR